MMTTITTEKIGKHSKKNLKNKSTAEIIGRMVFWGTIAFGVSFWAVIIFLTILVNVVEMML